MYLQFGKVLAKYVFCEKSLISSLINTLNCHLNLNLKKTISWKNRSKKCKKGRLILYIISKN